MSTIDFPHKCHRNDIAFHMHICISSPWPFPVSCMMMTITHLNSFSLSSSLGYAQRIREHEAEAGM